jgi:ATP-dependent Lon protease
MSLFKKSGDSEQQSAIADLRRKVADAKMPAGVEKIAEQELEMLTKISPASAE